MAKKVKLKKDLSKYHPSLIPGVVGEVVGVFGKHSRQFPRAFVGVKFPSHTLDVMWDDLVALKDEDAPRPSMGPQIEVKLPTPPKRGQLVEVGRVKFEVDSVEVQVDENTWLVNVLLAP